MDKETAAEPEDLQSIPDHLHRLSPQLHMWVSSHTLSIGRVTKCNSFFKK